MAMMKTALPGLLAPAFLLLAALLPVPAGAQQAQPQGAPAAQPAQAYRPPISAQPVPNELELAKLIWSTMVGVDHANRSGNYSVLRDNAASAFQINNDAARLTQIFAALRATRIDLSNTLLVQPGYLGPPQVVQPGVLQVRGYFAMRPTSVFFDLMYQWERGDWRLFGISVEGRPMAQVPGLSAPAPQPQPAPRRN